MTRQTCCVLPETVVALEWSGHYPEILVCWWGGLIYLSSRSTYFVFLIARPLCRGERKWQRITRQTCWLDFTVGQPAWLSNFLRHWIEIYWERSTLLLALMETTDQWSNAELSLSICYFHQLNLSIIIITKCFKEDAGSRFLMLSSPVFYFKSQENLQASTAGFSSTMFGQIAFLDSQTLATRVDEGVLVKHL